MKQLSSFIVAMLLVMYAAIAIEPSSQIVIIDGQRYYVHTVERGETLYSLARAYGVTEQQIIDSNEGLSAKTLAAGGRIFVPASGRTDTSSTDSPRNQDDGRYRQHVVSRGETLLQIATRYKISPEVIREDNPNVDLTKIEVGTTLRLRRSQIGYATTSQIEREWARMLSAAAENVTPGDGEYVVRPGETVYSLSRRFNLTESEFLALNNLSSSSDLRAGMTVRIAPDETLSRGERATLVDESVRRAEDDMMLAAEFANGYLAEDAVVATPVDVEFCPLGSYNTLKLALMLPFHNSNNQANGNYVAFYRGLLLALEDLKNEGHSIELSVFDTRNNMSRIQQIVLSEDGLLDANLIIGPVYEDGLRYVLTHAELNEVPVVSPLADIESVRSPVLFQMQAENDNKYDKLADMFDGSHQIITIYASSNDMEFASEIAAETGNAQRRSLNYRFDRESFFYERNSDGSNGAEVELEDLMRTSTPKAFVVVASNETDVDRILTTLSSTKVSIAGRGLTQGEYVVIGNRRWLQMATIDHQLFFNNNALFVVPYHAKRNEEVIRMFDARYVAAYGALPSMYSYRGYDAAMIFCRQMFTGIDGRFTNEEYMPLATTYDFDYVGGLYVNTNWTVEQYRSNYTIELR